MPCGTTASQLFLDISAFGLVTANKQGRLRYITTLTLVLQANIQQYNV